MFDEKKHSQQFNKRVHDYQKIAENSLFIMFDDLKRLANSNNKKKVFEYLIFLDEKLKIIYRDLQKVNKNQLLSTLCNYTYYYKGMKTLSNLNKGKRRSFNIEAENFIKENIIKHDFTDNLMSNKRFLILEPSDLIHKNFSSIYPDNIKLIQNLYLNLYKLYYNFLCSSSGIIPLMKSVINQNELNSIKTLSKISSLIKSNVRIIQNMRKTIKILYLKLGKML